ANSPRGEVEPVPWARLRVPVSRARMTWLKSLDPAQRMREAEREAMTGRQGRDTPPASAIRFQTRGRYREHHGRVRESRTPTSGRGLPYRPRVSESRGRTPRVHRTCAGFRGRVPPRPTGRTWASPDADREPHRR